jgi:hypothetical protein
MNRDAVLFHLKEAQEELARTISALEQDPKYAVGTFKTAMSHLYHHLNTAWNGKAASAKCHRECRQRDFDAWRKFPSAADLLLD